MCANAEELVQRGRAAVEADPLLWHALERIVEVAGEAAAQLSDSARLQHPDVEWRELIAVRVVLAHAYHRVDVDLPWGIASVDLPRVSQALGPVTANNTVHNENNL